LFADSEEDRNSWVTALQKASIGNQKVRVTQLEKELERERAALDAKKIQLLEMEARLQQAEAKSRLGIEKARALLEQAGEALNEAQGEDGEGSM